MKQNRQAEALLLLMEADDMAVPSAPAMMVRGCVMAMEWLNALGSQSAAGLARVLGSPWPHRVVVPA